MAEYALSEEDTLACIGWGGKAPGRSARAIPLVPGRCSGMTLGLRHPRLTTYKGCMYTEAGL